VNDAHPHAGASRVGFKIDPIAGTVASVCSSPFCATVDLILSIALLVIVLVRDGTLG
jgi:hypothetical protein